MAKRKTYYTLLEMTPGQLWTPEFGDYNRSVVAQEADDMKESGSFIKGTKFKIITSNGTQKDLMDKVEEINDRIVKARHKEAWAKFAKLNAP